MFVAIEMAKVADDMEKSTIAVWSKRAGDRVGCGEAIAGIETDKSSAARLGSTS